MNLLFQFIRSVGWRVFNGGACLIVVFMTCLGLVLVFSRLAKKPAFIEFARTMRGTETKQKS